MVDIIILATKKNISVLNISLPYIKRNIDHDKIYIVANKRDFEELRRLGVSLIDEESICEGMSFDALAEIIEEISGEGKRAGWYLQQFIKMSWARYTEKECYVVFDSDTIPLKPIDYISDEGRYYLTLKGEYHKPYFDTIEKLFLGEITKCTEKSFIAENMIIDSAVMREMICEIERNNSLKGNKFYEKILYAISKESILKSGFSEFETYGNYILSRYPDKVELRELRSLREAMQIIGTAPSKDQLEWAAQDYQIISIEGSAYKNTIITRATSNSAFRKICRMKSVAKTRTYIRSLYRKIKKREDYVFD